MYESPSVRQDNKENTMPVSSLVTGAVAGLGATIPMTLAMEVMHRSLPQHERYPLPPREITRRVSCTSWA